MCVLTANRLDPVDAPFCKVICDLPRSKRGFGPRAEHLKFAFSKYPKAPVPLDGPHYAQHGCIDVEEPGKFVSIAQRSSQLRMQTCTGIRHHVLLQIGPTGAPGAQVRRAQCDQFIRISVYVKQSITHTVAG